MIIVLLVVVTPFVSRPVVAGIDGYGNYVYLLSLLRGGDADFRDDYALIDRTGERHYRMADAPVSPVTERPANRYGPGAALFWSPWVLAVHAMILGLDPTAADGLSRPYQSAVAASSAFWGVLGVLLLARRLRREFDPAVTATTTVSILGSTSLAFYVFLHGSMSHAISFFAATVACLTLERAWRERTIGAVFWAGIWAGCLPTIRVQDATWTAALGLGLLVGWRVHSLPGGENDLGSCTKSISRGSAATGFGIGMLVGLLPLMASWRALYGSWLAGPLPYLGREGGSWSAIPEHLPEVLFSQRGGVFGWHPVLGLGFVGLLAPGILGTDRLRRTLLLGVLLQLYVVAGWSMWWGGDSFGNRFFVSAYPAFAYGLARGLTAISQSSLRRGVMIVCMALVPWNAGLFVQYGAHLVPRQEEVGWKIVVRQQFCEVPQWIARRWAGSSVNDPP